MKRWLIPVVVTLVMVSYLATMACGGSTLGQGEVDHKSVTGVVEDVAFTILRNVPVYDQDAPNGRPSIRVEDQDFQGFFTSKDEHAVVTVEMENELRQKYSDLSYIVHVRLQDGDQGSQSYLVSREVFNRILVDSPVRFKASGAPIPTIRKLFEPEE